VERFADQDAAFAIRDFDSELLALTTAATTAAHARRVLDAFVMERRPAFDAAVAMDG
jgi:hypothetical protein